MNCKQIRHGILKPSVAVGLMLGAAALFHSCEDDLLTGQPSWLGESIYDELSKDGNYKTTLSLIDDLGFHEQMSRTGSVTIFVADDDAFTEWFKTNNWGVRSYNQLTTAQKKQLLNKSMIKNAYLIELMSNVSSTPPEPGKAMRRHNSTSIFDSIYVMKHEDMNENLSAWAWYKQNKKDIILFKDGRMMNDEAASNCTEPMIHLLPAFLEKQAFTDEDMRILTNGRITSKNDAFVDGVKVIERDITCKNGYIHKVDGVIEGYVNMAEILRQHPNMSQWSRLIDRFSAPYYDKKKTEAYNRLYNQNVDSVFTLRYFASKRGDGLAATSYPITKGNPVETKVDATLAFDPGWNQYMYENTSGYDLHYDAGAMLVPTNEALDRWWNADGKVLKDMYKTWDNVPDKVLSKLLNVNMLGTFTDAIPSKFSSIVNDAKVSMGVTKEAVDSCFIGCNGVVYMVNRVFSPMEYSSVAFPALVHEDIMNVIYWAIDELEFTPYLNSMDSYYSLLLPTNSALMLYVDPCSYGDNQMTMLEFYYDTKEKKVKAHRYACNITDDGQIEKGMMVVKDVPSQQVENRLRDLMNQMIIVGNVENGYDYYKSKNGTMIKVNNAGQKNLMTVSGGFQLEHNTPIKVDSIYDLSETGNGKSYSMSNQVPLPASQSVYQTLQKHPEYSEFLKLLITSKKVDDKDIILSNSMKLNGVTYNCLSKNTNSNINLFGTYNYTVYVPTNESILKLINDGLLPTWDDYDAQYNVYESASTDEAKAQAKAACDIIKNRILNFVKYHLQDNGVAVNGAPETGENNTPIYKNNYETMVLNEETNRFYPIEVDVTDKDIKITDLTGKEHKVVKTAGLYNNICREYWVSGTGFNKMLYTSADAVVHLIDSPLMYSAKQNTPWRTEVSNAKSKRR